MFDCFVCFFFLFSNIYFRLFRVCTHGRSGKKKTYEMRWCECTPLLIYISLQDCLSCSFFISRAAVVPSSPSTVWVYFFIVISILSFLVLNTFFSFVRFIVVHSFCFMLRSIIAVLSLFFFLFISLSLPVCWIFVYCFEQEES